ncbi:MAG: nicotinate (nicotinamide) nucleotide adenylyltransferase [Planctomycetes bacterium]|nr:nicotinate (nicotinamide) nucleotide adenylyltransferase [Planctomycetota bacterium]
MRLGVFGGTFDPVHVGHLILAEQCREQASLDQVLFVPALLPPHKQQQPLTPFAQRVEMLSLALSGNPAFRIDELEKDRTGPSFTVDTMTELQARHRDAELCFIIGSDSLHDLPKWYEPRRILQLAELLVVERDGFATWSADELRGALQLADDFPLRYRPIFMPLITLASRDIRRRIAEGKTVRYMIPRAVEAYIADRGFYR